jgi:outer membrane protein
MKIITTTFLRLSALQETDDLQCIKKIIATRIPMKQIITALFIILLSFTHCYAAEYTLEDLYKIALATSERIKISAEELVIAEKTKDKAMSLLMPRLSAIGGYARYNDSKATDSGSYIQPLDRTGFEIRVDQSASLGGREITAFRITKEGIQKSKYDLYSVKEGYMLNVTAAYYDALRTDKLTQIAQANVERVKKYRDAAATRLKVGEITKTVLLRAEAELSGAQSELLRTDNNYRLAKTILARIVGIDGDYQLKEGYQPMDVAGGQLDAFVIEGCQAMNVECLKDKAVSERADLKALEVQKKIAEDQVTFTKGAYWPTLAVEGAYAKKDETRETGGLVKDSLYGGIRLSFPFFEGGLRVAEVQEAEAKKRQVEYVYSDLKKTIDVEVETAYLDHVTQKGLLKSLTDQYVFAKENYNSVSKQFDFGLASSLDVLDANTALLDAERQLANVIYLYQFSTLRLKRATGMLLSTIVTTTGAVNKTKEPSKPPKEKS